MTGPDTPWIPRRPSVRVALLNIRGVQGRIGGAARGAAAVALPSVAGLLTGYGVTAGRLTEISEGRCICSGKSESFMRPTRKLPPSPKHRTPSACSGSPYGGQDGANEPDQLI